MEQDDKYIGIPSIIFLMSLFVGSLCFAILLMSAYYVYFDGHKAMVGIALPMLGFNVYVLYRMNKINSFIHFDYKIWLIIVTYYLFWWSLGVALCSMELLCNPIVTTIFIVIVAAVHIKAMSNESYGPDFEMNRSIKPLNISGPPMFMLAAEQVVDELRDRDEKRYAELILMMPQIIYYTPLKVSGDPRGVFSLDGSDYEALRYMILHELGHHRYSKEKDADEYANATLRRIGAAPYERSKKLTCRYYTFSQPQFGM